MIQILSSLCFVQAQINYIYPTLGQTYFQSLERITQIMPDDQFKLQEMLTVQASNSNLMASSIIDVSEGSLAGTQNFQNQLIGILSESTNFYEYYIQQVDANGLVTTIISNTSAISKNIYSCAVILIIGNIGYIQCIAIQNNQLIIFYQQEQTSIFQTLETNIFVNINQLQLSDLNYYQNTTGEYLITTIVTNQSNVYCISIINPINSSSLFNSQNIYSQIQYLVPYNILMLRNNTNFEVFMNNQIIISLQSRFGVFSYYLFEQENVLIIALYAQTNIVIYAIDISTKSSQQIDIITSDSNQDILQMFMNSKYIILLSQEQLQVYQYGDKAIRAYMQINQDSFSFFLSQSNYIGMILNNFTQLAIQINQPALICYSCSGNGSFNLSDDQGIRQYQYFTLQNGDLNIYPKISDLSNNFTIIYSTQSLYVLDYIATGSNLSFGVQYPNLLITYRFYCEGATSISVGTDRITYFGITFVPESLLFISSSISDSEFCTYLESYATTKEMTCVNSTIQIHSAAYYQKSVYQTNIFMNTGQIIMSGEISSLANQNESIKFGPSLNVSADSNTTSNVIAMASISSNLYVLIPNMLLIYNMNSYTLQQTFNFNFRNIWTSDEYPGFLFCDNYQNLMVYQFIGNQYLEILHIPFQIQNISSVQIGLLTEGIYILELNKTNQALYFYNRQNIQMIQMNQIPFQDIYIKNGITLTNIVTFTSSLFYVYAINEGQTNVLIFQASESSFASLYLAFVILSISKITSLSCASNLIERFDVCYIISTTDEPLRVYIMHVCLIDVQSQFVVSSVAQNINISIYNGYSNFTTNATVNLENPFINIQMNDQLAPIITNSTEGYIEIEPQAYFKGCIQNYTINSNDSDVTITQLNNQVGNYVYETEESIYTFGYIFLGNDMNISIINGSELQLIYRIPNNSNLLNFFVEVNTGYPAWLTASTTTLLLNYYNMSSLQVGQVQMMTGVNFESFYGYYYNGPLIVGRDSFYCFNVTFEQFTIDQNCFGFIYYTSFETLGLVTIILKDGGTIIYQDIIKYRLTFMLDYSAYGGKQLGQAQLQGKMSYVSIMMADWFQLYQLNLHFDNYRLVSHKVTNKYYYQNKGANTYAVKVAASINAIIFEQFIQPESIISLYPVTESIGDSIIPTIAYLNISNASQAQCLTFVSDTLLVYSHDKVTLIYTVYDKLMINYTLTSNISNIQLTGQNLFSSQTQNITVNQWQPPIVPPSISKGFNYWIILWIFIGLVLIAIIVVGIVWFRKLRQEQEQLSLANSENYAELAHR